MQCRGIGLRQLWQHLFEEQERKFVMDFFLLRGMQECQVEQAIVCQRVVTFAKFHNFYFFNHNRRFAQNSQHSDQHIQGDRKFLVH